MNNTLETLRELGAQKIHTQTHISKAFIQAILHETFDGLNHVQFVGFISILEREYDADLSELKSQGLAHFSLSEDTQEVKKVFVVPKKKKSYGGVYLSLGILVVASFIYYVFFYLVTQSPIVETIDNSKIETAHKNLTQTLEIKNISVDENETKSIHALEVATEEKIVEEVKVEEVVIVEEVKVENTLKIVPKNRIWAGYINIKTNQKYQKVFKNDFSFDTTKNWLLLFGAGTVKLEVDGKAKKYSSKQNMRFKYIDGKLTKITLTEFKSLNKGSKW